MNKVVPALLILSCCLQQAHAQQPVEENDRNIVKMNVLGLLFRNYSFQYERLLSKKISVSASVRFMPEGQMPWFNTLTELAGADDLPLEIRDFRISHTAIAPEVRFYTGRRPGPRGFYIAPFARFSSYRLTMPQYEFEVDDDGGSRTETVDLNGSLSSFTGGFNLGVQWRLGKWAYLDWSILGLSYGTANGRLTGTSSMTLDQEAQQSLRDAMEDFDSSVITVRSEVDANGVRSTLRGPWAGVRTALSIGVKF